jgi:hypothetical protein
MDAEVSTHTFLTMIIEESVCFVSCEPIFFVQLFLCGTHRIYIYIYFFINCYTNRKCTEKSDQISKNIQNLSYTERLKYIGLPSLQYRRLRTDMVETFKILNNIDKVQHEHIFPISRTATRGHNQKIYKKNCRTNIRKYSFSQKIVNM